MEAPLRNHDMSRPTLRITRHEPQDGIRTEPSFAFEVWDPYQAAYLKQPSLDAALQAVDALLARLRQGWVDRAALTGLADVPDPDPADEGEWAEFRVSSQANRVHETRNWDVRHWRKAMAGREGALETTCNEVGYPR